MLLAVDGLTVDFVAPDGATVRALDGVSLTIDEGDAVGVLGASGSGKTTLLLSIPRLLPDTAAATGAVTFRAERLDTAPERRLEALRGAEIATVLQDPGTALHPLRRAGAQVAEVLRAHRRPATRDAALALLAEVGLDDPAGVHDAYPHQLSGGQRQRVAIAQAVACRPALLLADEPTASLDSVAAVGVLALLADLRRRYGLALLLVGHDPDALATTVDRLAVLHQGRLLEDRPAADLLTDPHDDVTRELLAARLRLPAPAG